MRVTYAFLISGVRPAVRPCRFILPKVRRVLTLSTLTPLEDAFQSQLDLGLVGAEVHFEHVALVGDSRRKTPRSAPGEG